MRTAFFTLLCLFVVSFTSCGDDDGDRINVTTDNIAGTWNLTKLDSELQNSAADFETSSATSSIANSTTTLEFNADGTWTSMGDYELTYMSNDTTEISTRTGGLGSGTYIVTNNSLTLIDPDGDDPNTDMMTFTITEYDPDGRLVGKSSLDEIYEDSVFMTTVTSEGEITLQLDR